MLRCNKLGLCLHKRQIFKISLSNIVFIDIIENYAHSDNTGDALAGFVLAGPVGGLIGSMSNSNWSATCRANQSADKHWSCDLLTGKTRHPLHLLSIFFWFFSFAFTDVTKKIKY
jgi:hypothetical protein